MTVMSRIEGRFCRSSLWKGFVRRSVLPMVAADHPWSGTVLEIGGGTGAMADALLRRQPDIDRLVLVDVDPAMTAAARVELEDHGERAEVLDSDGGALPVADAAVDTACAWLMLHHVIAWPDMIRDIRRALRPGGWFVGYDLTRAPVGHALHGLSRSDHRLIRPGELRRGLADAGFSDVQVTSAVFGQVMTFRARRPGSDGEQE